MHVVDPKEFREIWRQWKMVARQRIQHVLSEIDAAEDWSPSDEGFSCVPEPFDVIDLSHAEEQAWRDLVRAREIISSKSSITELSMMELHAVAENSRQWQRFWSIRHPDPALREAFGRDLEEGLELKAESQELAREELRTRRIEISNRRPPGDEVEPAMAE
jgi:hypothetical protein